MSDRYRNPVLGMPDAWEAQTLERFRGRHADGEDYTGMIRSAFVDEPGASYYRYMQAIPMQGLCLSCHGAAEALVPSVRDSPRRRYPHDRATGFSVGELRGAVSIRQPVD